MRDSTQWIIGGPKTFRLGSRKVLGGFGGNLQNLEKSARVVYIPDEGKMLGQRDQSGAEALIVAYLCEDGQYRELFKNKIKPHSYLGMHLFKHIWPKKMREHDLMAGDSDFNIDALCKTPIKDLTSNPWWKPLDLLIKDSDDWSLSERYYYLAKQTEHSSNYGIEAATFRMNILEKSGGKINIDKDEAARFLLVKHSLFPEIQDWHRRLKRQVEQTRIIFDMHGFPYTVTSYMLEESKWKELFAIAPQMTVGMITNIAFAEGQAFIEKNKLDWDLLINGHDSIVAQFPIEEMKDFERESKLWIEKEFESPVDGAKFRMGSDFQAGFNWSPYKEKKNPLGLKKI